MRNLTRIPRTTKSIHTPQAPESCKLSSRENPPNTARYPHNIPRPENSRPPNSQASKNPGLQSSSPSNVRPPNVRAPGSHAPNTQGTRIPKVGYLCVLLLGPRNTELRFVSRFSEISLFGRIPPERTEHKFVQPRYPTTDFGRSSHTPCACRGLRMDDTPPPFTHRIRNPWGGGSTFPPLQFHTVQHSQWRQGCTVRAASKPPMR